MKCWLPNVHKLFLCTGFSFSGSYSSQQFSQNTILLTTIKFKTLQDYFCKIQGFQSLKFGPFKFKAFQDFQGPVWTLGAVLTHMSGSSVIRPRYFFFCSSFPASITGICCTQREGTMGYFIYCNVCINVISSHRCSFLTSLWIISARHSGIEQVLQCLKIWTVLCTMI